MTDELNSSERPRRSLWFDQRRCELRWETDNGPVVLSYPRLLTPTEIDDLEAVIALTFKSLRRTSDVVALTTNEQANHE